MRKLFNSSFFILTTTALLCGAIGALLSGMWDLEPPAEGIYSFGSYFDGAKFGSTLALIGLIPYWGFHIIKGDAFYSWELIDKKIWRLTWVFCWATFISFFFSRGLAV